MRHAGQVLTRQQLLDSVWGIDFDAGSNVVDVYVSYLRRKLDRVERTVGHRHRAWRRIPCPRVDAGSRRADESPSR